MNKNTAGEITAVLKLDISQYIEQIRVATALGRQFEIANGNLKLNIGSPTGTGAVQTEFQRLEGFLTNHSANLKNAGDSTKKFGDETQSAGTKTRQFGDDINNLKGPASTANAQMQALTSTVTTMVTTFLATKGWDIFTDLVKTGETLTNLRKSFDNFNQQEGNDTDIMMQKLKTSTAGTVSDLKLLQYVAQGKFLGTDVQNMPVLLEFASIRAKETGQSVDYLVQSMLIGLGRKSPLILDNLGLKMSDLDAAVIKVAQSHGHHITQVDETARSMYLVEAAMLVAKEQIDNSNISITDQTFELDRTITKWDNLKDKIGEALSEDTLNILTDFNEGMKNMGVESETSIEGIGAVLVKSLLGFTTWGQGVGIVFEKFTGALITTRDFNKKFFENLVSVASDGADEFKGKIGEMNDSLTMITDALGLPPPDTFFSALGSYFESAIQPAYDLWNIIVGIQSATKGIVGHLKETGSDKVPKGVDLPGIDQKATLISKSGRSGRTGRTGKTEKEIQTELERLKKQLEEESKILDRIISQGRENTNEWKNQSDKVEDLKKKIAELSKLYDDSAARLKALLDGAKLIDKKMAEIQKLRQDAQRDIRSKQIDLIKDEFEKRRQEIDQTYDNEIDRINELNVYLAAEKDLLIQLAEEKRKSQLQQLDEDILKKQQQAIISSDEFQLTQMALTSLTNTFRDGLVEAWEKSFGEADTLAERFILDFVSSLADALFKYVLSSALNAIFPGAGIIPTIFGGGGASAAGLNAGNTFNNSNFFNVPSAPPIINIPVHISGHLEGQKFLVKHFPGYVDKVKRSDM